VWVAGKTVWSL